MSDDELISAVEGYYTGRVTEHGATPRGVDWNDESSQDARFDELLKVLGPDADNFSLNDYGSGYGALLGVLAGRHSEFTYRGFDVSAPMIAEAERLHGHDPRASFTTDPAALRPADFTIASGIFNVKLDMPETRWRDYVLATLDTMVSVSTKGIAFNALTSHADENRKRPDLHYADPAVLLDHCLRSYSRTVAVFHDYALYEFTVVVRLDGRPPAIRTPQGETT
jgi:hypothetical protein